MRPTLAPCRPRRAAAALAAGRAPHGAASRLGAPSSPGCALPAAVRGHQWVSWAGLGRRDGRGEGGLMIAGTRWRHSNKAARRRTALDVLRPASRSRRRAQRSCANQHCSSNGPTATTKPPLVPGTRRANLRNSLVRRTNEHSVADGPFYCRECAAAQHQPYPPPCKCGSLGAPLLADARPPARPSAPRASWARLLRVPRHSCGPPGGLSFPPVTSPQSPSKRTPMPTFRTLWATWRSTRTL